MINIMIFLYYSNVLYNIIIEFIIKAYLLDEFHLILTGMCWDDNFQKCTV